MFSKISLASGDSAIARLLKMATKNKRFQIFLRYAGLCIVPVAMDITAKAPQIIKIILLLIFANMIGAKHDAANLNVP